MYVNLACSCVYVSNTGLSMVVMIQSHQSPQKEDTTILTCIHVQYICLRSMLLEKCPTYNLYAN